MKKFFIFLLSIIILLGIIAGTVVIYFLKTLDANKIVSIASNEIEKFYGFKVLAGNAYFDIKKGLALDDVKLIDISNNSEVFTSKRFFLSYEPSLLLKEKKLKISKIRFIEAFTTLDNLNKIISRFSSKKEEPSIVRIEINNISFEDSTLEYRKKKISVDGNVETLSKRVLYKLKASYKDTKIDFNGNFDEAKVSMKNFNFGDWIDMKISLYVEDTYFVFKTSKKSYQLNLSSFKGKYEDKTILVSKPFKLDISNKMSAFFFEDVELNYNNENNFSIRRAVYFNDKTFFVDVSKSEFMLEEFLKGFKGSAEGSFSFDSKNRIPVMGNLRLKNLSYQNFTNFNGDFYLEGDNFGLKGQGYFCGVNFSVDANSVDINQGNIYINLNIPLLELEGFLKKAFSSSPSQNNLPFKSATFNIGVEKLIYKDFVFKNVTASGDVNSERLNILSASGEIFNGKLACSGFLEGGILNLKLNYDRGKLNEFSSLYFKDERRLYGTISFESRFQMKPFNFSSIDGTIKGVINYGELENIFIQKRLNEFLSDIPLDHVYFDKIDFDIGLKNSKLKINSVEFKSAKINSTIKGEYSIPEDLISLTIFLSFSKNYLKDIPNIANLIIKGKNRENWVDFSLFAEGNSKNLKFTFLDVQ
ncbi:MAG: AsmA-like C-terminal region-containing protein [Brevinematia bacterium]